MKKILPIFLLALLAVAGCQNRAASYEMCKDGKYVIENAKAFADEVSKGATKYSADDWNAVLDGFSMMCKDYKTNEWQCFDKDKEAFSDVLTQFITAVDATGNPELPRRVKKIHAEIMNAPSETTQDSPAKVN